MEYHARAMTGATLAVTLVFGLAACQPTPPTVVCWEEPVAQPRVGMVSNQKYHPGPAMRTVCAPVSVRRPGQPHGPGAFGAESAKPSPGPAPGPNPSEPEKPKNNPPGGAQTGQSPVAWSPRDDGEIEFATTIPHEDGGGVVVGTLSDMKTGDQIREAVKNLGDEIRSEAQNDVR